MALLRPFVQAIQLSIPAKTVLGRVVWGVSFLLVELIRFMGLTGARAGTKQPGGR